MEYNIAMKIKTYQKIKLAVQDYEIYKIISEQFRLVSWASAAVWLWFGFEVSKIKAAIVISLIWMFFQSCSIYLMTQAKKFKKE